MCSLQQLPLPLRFDQSRSFEHFYSNDGFETHSLSAYIDSLHEALIVIKGEKGTGKSHLLNASALYCQQKNIPFQYFEAAMLLDYGIEVITDCLAGSVLIIDDVHLVAKNKEWECKLYDLYNHAQRFHWVLIVSGLTLKLNNFQLKDWLSRLAVGVQINLAAASGATLKKILQLRSKLLGLKLKPEVIDYMAVHFSRELSVQIDLLKILDEQALKLKRNITIPFIKESLNKPEILSALKVAIPP